MNPFAGPFSVANPKATAFEGLTAIEQRALVSNLRDLSIGCLAARAAYEESEKKVGGDPSLHELLGTLARQRGEFADALGALLAQIGHAMAEPKESLGAEIHRRWIDLRAALEHGNPATLVAECERSERALVGKYERVLEQAISLEVEELVLDQLSEIRQARAGLDRLRRPW